MGRRKKIAEEVKVEEVAKVEIPVEPRRVIAKVTTDFNRTDLNELRDRLNDLVDVINSQ